MIYCRAPKPAALIESALLRLGVWLKTGIHQQDWTRLSEEMEWNRRVRERETCWQRVCQWLRNTSGAGSCTAEREKWVNIFRENVLWLETWCRYLCRLIWIKMLLSQHLIKVVLEELLDCCVPCSLIILRLSWGGKVTIYLPETFWAQSQPLKTSVTDESHGAVVCYLNKKKGEAVCQVQGHRFYSCISCNTQAACPWAGHRRPLRAGTVLVSC